MQHFSFVSQWLDVSGQTDNICFWSVLFWSLSFFSYLKLLYALKFQQLLLKIIRLKKYEWASKSIKPINHWTLTILKVVKPYQT